MEPHAKRPGTLGDVLYGGRGKPLVSESEWVDLVRCVAAADQLALHALFERAHRIVFTLAVRITGSRESGEEVTLDVFHDVWRRAGSYDPVNGTVLGWIMNQARSRAIDRVRFEQRKKRQVLHADEMPDEGEAIDPRELLELKQQGAAMRAAMAVLNRDEREAIELAFLSDLTHAQVAARLGQPLGTIKTRIRSGLQKVRNVMGVEKSQS